MTKHLVLRLPRASQCQSFSFRPAPHKACPLDDEWHEVPGDKKIGLHVVARGNTDNLRTTLMTLAEACYPEVSGCDGKQE